jgi:hypothetical protein
MTNRLAFDFSDLPSASEWWEALRWVFVVFSFVVLITMIGSFIAYERVIQDGHPWLPKIICSGCPLCGMTRSFCAMSSGYWSKAFEWNRGGPILYIIGWSWLLSLSVFFMRRLVNKYRRQFYLKREGV